jgi:hypothetical protein
MSCHCRGLVRDSGIVRVPDIAVGLDEVGDDEH